MSSSNKGFKILKQFTKGKEKKYILSVVLAVVGVFCGMVPYYAISKIAINLVDKNVSSFSSFSYWLTVILIALVAKVVFHNLSTTVSHKATFSVISSIRKTIAEKLVNIPMGYVLGISSGSFKSMMVEKADSTEPILAHAVPEMTSNILIPILIYIYIFILDWRMGLAAMITLPIGYIAFLGMMKDYEVKYKEMMDVAKHMNSTAVEYVNGIKVIKAFSQSASSYNKYRDAVKNNAEYGLQWMKSVQGYFAIGLGIWPAVLIGVLPIGCILFMNGSLAADVFITIIVLSFGIFGPILQAMNFIDDLAKVNTIMEDIGDVVEQADMNRTISLKKTKGSDIVLKNVSFAYDEEKVLDDVSLSFKEGQVSALVGPSGSGKSTIAKLIASFWDVSEGSIEIGGVNISNLSLEELNSKIAYVSQDNFLFNESILENIRKAKLGASDAEIVNAAKIVGCHKFIMSLENGYNTVVGGSGSHLSGGERQRITIARAMLKNAPIIILDEATAYTDPENEAIIQDAVSKLAKGKTLIVIAHRLSTIKDSDQIIVVSEGKINGSGKFDYLLESNKLFGEMWKAHEASKDFAIEEEEVEKYA